MTFELTACFIQVESSGGIDNLHEDSPWMKQAASSNVIRISVFPKSKFHRNPFLTFKALLNFGVSM